MDPLSTLSNLEPVAEDLVSRLFAGSRRIRLVGLSESTKSMVARCWIEREQGAVETLVVKWFARGREANYTHERDVLGRVSTLEVAPNVLGADDEHLLLAVDDLGDQSEIEALATALARLHGRSFAAKTDVGSSLLDGLENLAGRASSNLAAIGVNVDATEDVGKLFETLGRHRCVVHGDVILSNARRTALGPRLIDFEEAAIGSPLIDALAPAAGFPTAAEPIAVAPADQARFESLYRESAASWWPEFRDADHWDGARAAGIAYWVIWSLSWLKAGTDLSAAVRRLPALRAGRELDQHYPRLRAASTAVLSKANQS